MITLLDHTMFDDGSIDCLNFWLADEDGCNQVDASFIRTLGLVEAVETARTEGKSHLSLKNSELVYGGLRILEIQWG